MKIHKGGDLVWDNNPIMRVDESGYLWETIVKGFVVGYITNVASQLISGKLWRKIHIKYMN